MTDMLDVSRWAKNNPDLIKRNPELNSLLHSGEMPAGVSKYRNVRTKDPDGEVYDSGKEAADAVKFAQAVKAGEYVLYAHHVRVTLPSGNKLELDHVLINNQFQVEVYDTKALDYKTGKYISTPDWKNKAKEFKAAFGIEIVPI
jgi:hypothetical protein